MKDDFADGGVERWGKNPADVVEKWINGEYEFQSSQKVPDWMMPDLDNSGYATQFDQLVKKYENDYEASRNLERIRAGVSRNSVMSYMNQEHGEINTIWKLDKNYSDPGRIDRITQGQVPFLTYTADGHPILKNDSGIDHGRATHYNMVRERNGTLHSQIDMDNLPLSSMNDFQVEAEGQVEQSNPAQIQQSVLEDNP